MESKSNTVITKCPNCNHLNIADTEFYRIRCNECGEIFINDKCTLILNDTH